MNDIINGLHKYYNQPNISGGEGNVVLMAHEDRVGFFVFSKISKYEYIILRYGNIEKEYILGLENIYSNIQGNIKIEINHYIGNYYIIKTDKELTEDEFLGYSPEYSIEGEYIVGPYLDNLISIYAISKINSDIKVVQSIDEETHMRYSQFIKGDVIITLDTIWQEYLSEKIDLDAVYNIKETKFNKYNELLIDGIHNLNINIPFKLESDIILGKNLSKNVISLFIPIIDGHKEKSMVKIKTIHKYIALLQEIVDMGIVKN